MGVGGVLQGGMGVLQGGIGDPKMRPRGPPRVGGGVLQGRGGRPRRSPGRGPGISCGSSPLRSAVSRTGAPPYRGTSWPGRTGPNRDAPNRKRSGTEGAAAHFRFLRKERSAGRGEARYAFGVRVALLRMRATRIATSRGRDPRRSARFTAAPRHFAASPRRFVAAAWRRACAVSTARCG